MEFPIVVFGYGMLASSCHQPFADYVLIALLDVSPRAEKIWQYLTATKISYQTVQCSLLPPRHALRKLGIVYRRIPVIAIGKDVYCDTALSLEAMQTAFPQQALPTSQADEAYASWAQAVSSRALILFPIHAAPKEIAEDRASLFR
jgi:hypothetical protein